MARSMRMVKVILLGRKRAKCDTSFPKYYLEMKEQYVIHKIYETHNKDYQ